jgi:hypothetical protein
MTDRMVDNPRRDWLQSLLDRMSVTCDAMRPILDRAAADVGSGKVWSGSKPAADFERDLTGRSRRIHTLVDGLRSTVEDALRAEPLQVTQAQARQMQFGQRDSWNGG